jgi:type I restriction enzyme M protein
MSEELISKGYVKRKGGIKLGKYDYFDTNRTNINSFVKYGFIPKKDYGVYAKREPDGLLVDLTNKKSPQVIVVLEYKKPEEFRTKNHQKEAREQCNDLCQVLNAFVGVVSDGHSTHWINPKQSNTASKYKDRTTGKQRSYSIIQNEDKKPLSENFILQVKSELNDSKFDEETKNTFYYLDRILACVDDKNSQLKTNEDIDPTRLAESVWQDIYINTAKSPVKCLYNVVELFIFKFLSDLNILQHPYNFDYVLKLATENNGEIALSYYAKNVRPVIKDDLFKPSTEDKTTIINGTIFVDENEQPVKAQASLFKQSLIKYGKFGSLRNIQKDFKTKLFENFLKQSSDKNKLGQFFTPRKVVTSLINITDYENFRDGMRICDPFCGVGGFIAEFLQKPSVRKRFFPDNTGKINPKISFLGFDKGLDSDDERTIILAKANMLIYLSDILEKYPKHTEAFSNLLNNTFTLIKDNIGTLGKVFENEEDKFDLIITNPPYITAGSTSIKKT